jgi:hypothetical protein
VLPVEHHIYRECEAITHVWVVQTPADSASTQSERQARQFDKFRSIVKRLNKDGINQPTRSELTNALFRLTTETHLLAEILDIQDELKTIHEVLQKQQAVLREFFQLLQGAPRKRSTDAAAVPESPGPQAEKKPFDSALRNDGSGARARRTVHFDVAKDDERRWHQMSKAKRQAAQNLDLVSSNIATIKQMLGHAGKVQVEVSVCSAAIAAAANDPVFHCRSMHFSAIGRSKPTRGKRGSRAKDLNTRSVRAM